MGGRERERELFQHAQEENHLPFPYQSFSKAHTTDYVGLDLFICLFIVSSATEVCVLHMIMPKSAGTAGENFCRAN